MARKEKPEEITIRGAAGNQLIFRNFEGAAGKFNNAGDRNFCLIIDDELAGELQSKGWTIKHTKAKEDYDSVAYIKIKVGFTLKDGTDNPYPPKIFKIDSSGMRMLDKTNVKLLDGARISNADLVFSAYSYEDRTTGEIRYSAYLRNLYATIEENDLERYYNEKYAAMGEPQDPSQLPFNL